jgi:hypothetical protein
MVAIRQLLTDFTGGEVSPRVSTRADLARYEKSCASVRNFIPLQQGGVLLRRGTQRMGEALASAVSPAPVTLIIPWRAGSASDPDILLEIVGNTVRGWTNDGRIETTGVPYSLILPITITARTQWAQRANIIALTDPSYPPVILRIDGLRNWSASVVPRGTFPLRVFDDASSPPKQDAEYEVTFTGFVTGYTYRVFVGGKGVNFDPDKNIDASRKVTYLASNTAENVKRMKAAIVQSPLIPNPDEVTVSYVSGTTYRVEFSGSVGGIDFSVETAEDGTRQVGIVTNSDGRTGAEPAWSYPTVVLYSGTYYQCIKAHISTASPNPSADTTNWLPLTAAPAWESLQPSATWSGAGVSYGLGNRGFPRACAFHQQRLFLGGTPTLPQTFWGSAIGSPTNFKLGAESDEALSVDIDAQDAPAIRWMTSQQGLLIGTSAGVWRADAEITLSPTDVQLTMFSADRTAERLPQVVGNEVVFISQDRTQLLAFRRNEQVGPYETTDLSALAEHLGRYRLERVVYCRQPQPIVYVQTDEPGLLLAISYNRQYDMTAFARIVIDGHIDAIASAFDEDDGDVLWLCVRRGDRASIERMAYPATDPPTAVPSTTATVHLDGWVTGTAAAGHVGGLRHLLGKTVTVLNSDGSVQGSGVVALGGPETESSLTVTNPGWETGDLTGWTVTGSTAVASTDFARTGTYSLRITGGIGQIVNVRSANIAVTAGRTVRARCYWRGDTGDAGFVPIVIEFYDGSANLLAFYSSATPSGNTSTWTVVELTATVPAGAVNMKIGPTVQNYSATIPVLYVDDVQAFDVIPTDGRVAATGSNLTIGVPFLGYLETLEPVGGNPAGPSFGNKKRWPDAIVKLYQSALPKINGNRPSDYSQAGGAYRANPGTLRTGEYEVTAAGWNSGRIVIEQDLPHRTEVIAVYGEMKVN